MGPLCKRNLIDSTLAKGAPADGSNRLCYSQVVEKLTFLEGTFANSRHGIGLFAYGNSLRNHDITHVTGIFVVAVSERGGTGILIQLITKPFGFYGSLSHGVIQVGVDERLHTILHRQVHLTLTEVAEVTLLPVGIVCSILSHGLEDIVTVSQVGIEFPYMLEFLLTG